MCECDIYDLSIDVSLCHSGLLVMETVSPMFNSFSNFAQLLYFLLFYMYLFLNNGLFGG